MFTLVYALKKQTVFGFASKTGFHMYSFYPRAVNTYYQKACSRLKAIGELTYKQYSMFVLIFLRLHLFCFVSFLCFTCGFTM